MTLLEKMTLLPTRQSCPTWLLARKAQRSPITVCMPPPSVPGFMVTPSRMMQSLPTSSVEGSPLYFRSWGWWPIEANGKMLRPGADAGAAGDDHVAHQLDPVCERDLAADQAEGTDAHTLAEPGPRLDDRRRVRPHILASSGSRIMALTSASATTCPFTLASP